MTEVLQDVRLSAPTGRIVSAETDRATAAYRAVTPGERYRRYLVKRFAIAVGLAATMLLPGTALAFHHTGLPATVCHAPAAGSPSNDNGMAKEALLAHSPRTLPLPPVGTPGDGQGDGGDHCANAPAD